MSQPTTAGRPLPTGAADYAIQTEGLRKTYRTRKGRSVAVAGLDLTVESGGVHGFLGPNGSGKTTTIRMLLGLITADSGTMKVFGEELPRRLPAIIDRIGAIVEQPKFFPNFSGAKNLKLLAQGMGASQSRVAVVLEEVGLGSRGKDRFRTYSLGMKQRLAIAGTLLKDPELLIFDEPTNGLDPAGIHEIRGTMRGLAERGKTVLVSSHILSEVQQVADTVSIIGRGRLLAEGGVEEILASDGTGMKVRVGVRDPERAAGILTRFGFLAASAGPDALTVAPATSGSAAGRQFDPAQITRLLAAEGLYVHELTQQRVDLESVFLQLTQDEHLGQTQHEGFGLHQAPGNGHQLPPPGDEHRPAHGSTEGNAR